MMTSTIALMKAIRSMRPVGGSPGVCVDDMIVLATQYICKFLLLDQCLYNICIILKFMNHKQKFSFPFA